MLSNSYGAAAWENPGGADFEEDELHSVSAPALEQFKELLRLARPLKMSLAAVVPLFLAEAAYCALAPGAGPAAHTLLCATALLGTAPLSVLLVEVAEDVALQNGSATIGVAVNATVEHAAEILFTLSALAGSVLLSGAAAAAGPAPSPVAGQAAAGGGAAQSPSLASSAPPLNSVSGGGGHSRARLRLQETSQCWVKPVLVGCALFELLGALGASALVSPAALGGSEAEAGATWSFGGSALLTSVAVFMFPTVYAMTAKNPGAPAALLAISRLFCVMVLLVYAVHMAQMKRFYKGEAAPNTPSSVSVALLRRERAAPTRQTLLARDPLYMARFSRSFALAAAAVLLLLEAAMVAAVAACLTQVVAFTGLPLSFLLVVVLPVVFRQPSLWASLTLAADGRLDMAGGSAMSAVVNIFSGILPGAVVAAALVGVPLHASLHPFLAFCCVLSVLVASQVPLSQYDVRVGGALLLALYTLVASVSLMGDWQLCYRLM